MQNQNLNAYNPRDYRVSFVCKVLCGIILLVLGMLPRIPGAVTIVFRPIFIALCLLTMHQSSYYSLGSTKYHILNLIYYTLIFFSFTINAATIETYISIALFVLFLIFAANRQWTKREAAWILIAVVIACDIQSIITLYCNPGMLKNSSSQHLDFLGAIVNRNPVAYAITPGAVCGMLIFLYDSNRSSLRKLFYLCSCLICSFAIFAIGCRGAFMAAAAGLFCVVWQKTREGRNSTQRFERRILAIVIILAVLFAAMTVSKGTYSSRLFEFGEESSDSGRDAIWEEAWELIDEKPMFGGGFDRWKATGHQMGTHNTFLTFMVSGGWVAGILLGLFLFAALLEMLKTRNLIPLAFMAEVLAHSWAEPGMDYYAYIPLVVAFIITRYLQYQSKDLRTIFS